MKESRKGEGDTILRENHLWGDKSIAAGTVDNIPVEWKFTKERVEFLMNKYA